MFSRSRRVDLLVAALFVSLPGYAQPAAPPIGPLAPSFTADNIGKGYGAITEPWAFHPGDNPAWGSPGFDDSGWSRIETGKTSEQQGFRDLTGFAWYRRRVELDGKAGGDWKLALYLPVVQNAAEVYWNGRLYAGLSHTSTPLILWSNGVVEVDWSNLFDLLNLIAIAAVLILRFTRSAQEEKRLATELASARAVQDRLVPVQLPVLPGLHLDAAYLPAAEVDGDFYQVFPQSDGCVLVIISDVSGKGLKAAMTGTLVLGALRSLAQEGQSPAQVLSRLNAQLAESSDGGFVTCLCAGLAADGKLTLANAVHLPPYRNGEEVSLDSGLPLGIRPDTIYAEPALTLNPGDSLTFLSDGVVEAQSASGELFGFDRTRGVAARSAEEIAKAAQTFGQQDDISALTLQFAPAEVFRV